MLLGLLLATLNFESSAARSPVPDGVTVDSLPWFPHVEGTNLEGRKLSLPTGFGAQYNVVLVAFRREQQADVDTWMPFLREQIAQHGVRVYELPTLGRSLRMMRGIIDGGMARGIADRATREATITLYIDKSPFKRALAIASENCIRAMLVTRDGRVLWRADGTFTAALGQELAELLAVRARERVPSSATTGTS